MSVSIVSAIQTKVKCRCLLKLLYLLKNWCAVNALTTLTEAT